MLLIRVYYDLSMVCISCYACTYGHTVVYMFTHMWAFVCHSYSLSYSFTDLHIHIHIHVQIGIYINRYGMHYAFDMYIYIYIWQQIKNIGFVTGLGAHFAT